MHHITQTRHLKNLLNTPSNSCILLIAVYYQTKTLYVKPTEHMLIKTPLLNKHLLILIPNRSTYVIY